MIDFILNDRDIHTGAPPSGVLLDFLRDSRRLMGTKEACHGEGACGACLVLVGGWNGKTVCYRSMNSCLLPLAEVAGKHVVTIEGLNPDDQALGPIQQAIVDEGATQCGYCTPGIVLALTGLFLDTPAFSEEQAIAAIGGNLCRCTGYQSIRRALTRLRSIGTPPLAPETGKTPMERLVEKGIVPPYFLEVPGRLRALPAPGEPPMEIPPKNTIVGGGTDLWVQRADDLQEGGMTYLSRRADLKGIRIGDGRCRIGAATTFREMEASKVMRDLFPDIGEYFRRIASEPIRNRATVGGNIVNASPIGDVTVFLLALDASLVLNKEGNRRELALKDFFLGYKRTGLRDNELLEEIIFPCWKNDNSGRTTALIKAHPARVPARSADISALPTEQTRFNFEKVSKTTHQDIASVNSAIQITMKDGVMARVHLSAGGVAPIPLYLSRTVAYLTGRKPDVDCAREAASLARSEISPIDDARGSAAYKRLLLDRLIHAHISSLFPGKMSLEGLREEF
uniref:Xanthine dehydrogenase small subunit n=1 Tax=Candidatus Kentrum sp. DK TaxID=2126562 RepID=A0A450TA48_9GAMM|nr:MAG: xanthine dehydrogenase small subunit [Candidatus Kentron sp. DK]